MRLKLSSKKNGQFVCSINNRWWGSPMGNQNGFYEYGISPYQLKPFKGMLNPGLPQFLKRTGRQLLFIGPPLVFFYSVGKWADKKVFFSEIVRIL
jgi:hypothetical protein